MERLRDLGEYKVIETLLKPRYGDIASFGSDCSVLPKVAHGATLVVTTDPCPEPMAAILGFDDPYYRGWLLAAINLSDIAASGAAPLGLVTSLILPDSTLVTNFCRLLDGIDACCKAVGTRVVGGNLKEGSRIELQATAVGAVNGKILSREGCRAGDYVVVIGDLGQFWAGALSVRRNLGTNRSYQDDLLQNVLTPVPKVRVGRELHEHGLLAAAMDNSDGLGATFEILAAQNDVAIDLDLDVWEFADSVMHVAGLLEVSPVRLAMGWGDWQLVVCVHPEHIEAAREICVDLGYVFNVVGTVRPGRGTFVASASGRIRLSAPASERFSMDSWFSRGIDSYIEQLLSFPLP